MRSNIIIVLLLCLAASWTGIALAQDPAADKPSESVRYWEEKISQGIPSKMEEQQLPSQEELESDIVFEKSVEFRMLQEKHRMWLLIAIVVSTPILLALVLFCLKSKPDCPGESLVNAVGLVLVVEGTMFIAVSAVTSEQLTAPIGILGAITGYLFGSARRKAIEDQAPPEPKEPT